MSNVAINIAAEFTGKKAFKQAETSTDKLNKNVKTLGKSLLAVYSAQKLISYARASVKAFAEDDKAAQALGITLKNLGLAYGANVGTVNGFISRLESQTGVLDDELRPALDGLLRATGSVTKAQELLALSLDIAAGTGKSVVQVSTALQRAYLGQTTGLSRLGAGLTKAELSTASFEEIQTRLSTLFAGQATAAADTYAGSLAKLTVAGENAKEVIGKGLVDAFVTASNSSSIDDLIGKIDSAAEAIAGFLRETGKFIQITKDIFKFDLFATDPNAFKGMGNISMTVSGQVDNRTTKQLAASAAAQTKAAKDTAKATKENLKLSKAKAIFDLQKIQIEAALKGKISEEERLRLKLMQAIEEENITQIEKYTKLLDQAQAKTLELVNTLSQLKFPQMELPTILQPNGKEFSSFTSLAAQTSIQPNLKEWSSSFSPSAMLPATPAATPSMPPVVVNVQGSVIAENDLAQTINDALAQSNWAGGAVGYKRQAGLTAI